MSALLATSHDAGFLPLTEIGGKAANLAWLSDNAFPVPAWSVLTVSAFRQQLRGAGLDAWIEQCIAAIDPNNSASVSEAAAQIQARILASPLEAGIREVIADFVAGREGERFAVRSSVVDEDGDAASFAGQMDSQLYCLGQEAIEQAVLVVMASAFNERALIYRLHRGVSLEHIQAAVILQEMVDSDVAGVMFTAHPVTGSRRHALISGTWGCGEGIVSGLCVADEFTVELDGTAIESTIQEKDTCLVMRDGEYGTIEQPVEECRREQPVLTTEQIFALRDLGKQVANLKRFPQDIEWALKDGTLYLLQTRPVTSLPANTSVKAHPLVWDNSNIQESYCGVTTPLTFSFAQRAYTTVYTQTLRVLGVKEEVIEAHRDMLENMLAFVRGRIYYNINNWYRGLLFLPSFSTNKEDLERMMGLQDPVDMIQDQTLTFIEKLKRLPQLLRALTRMLSGFRRMPRMVAEFRQHFEHTYNDFDRSTLHTLSPGELIRLARHLDKVLLDNWTTPIINDFYVMMSNGKLHRYLVKAGIGDPGIIQNNLLSGEAEIESTEPTKMLLGMCDYLRERPSLRRLVVNEDNQDLMKRIRHADPHFHALCEDYIERYGDRVMGELKLESITLRQDPGFMFSVLRNFLSRDDLTLEALNNRESALRHETQSAILPKVEKALGRRQRRRFEKVLEQCRSAIKHRENMRLARTRTFALYRDIFLEIGNQLAFYGKLEAPRDIFWLTVDELYAWNDGRAVQTEWKSLVAARQAEYQQYHDEEPPHHFITHDVPYLHNEFRYPHEQTIDEEASSLRGIGCYPGVVEGKIRLIFSPDDELNLNGQILCTVRTDPGWAPLFPTAGGLLVERGSTLSHSAVVARELGIPAVVGVPGLTAILKDGETVRMDGAAGTIHRNASDLAGEADNAA